MSVDPRLVSAVLVTRGDVDLAPILDSLPPYEVVVWNNAERPYDAGVFGRYVAIAEATRPVIYFQDDDCLLSGQAHEALLAAYELGVVVGNMLDHDPARLKRYADTTLLGWGSLFDRDLPAQAFAQYERFHPIDLDFKRGLGAEIAFPMLSRTKTIVAGIEWLDDDGPVFQRKNRMWKQPGFYDELDVVMARARLVREMMAA